MALLAQVMLLPPLTLLVTILRNKMELIRLCPSASKEAIFKSAGIGFVFNLADMISLIKHLHFGKTADLKIK